MDPKEQSWKQNQAKILIKTKYTSQIKEEKYNPSTSL